MAGIRAGRERAWVVACKHPVMAVLLIGLLASCWHLFRAPRDFGFDPDQAAYLITAIRFRDAIGSGQLVSVIAHSGNTAPLVPLMTLPLIALWPHTPVAVLLIPLMLYVGGAMAIAALTVRLAHPVAGLVAGIICLGTPTGIILARSYLLPLGTSMFLVLATLALVRSERGRRRGMLVVFGGAVGLMLLTRVVAAALLPGILMALVIQVERSRVALRNTLLAIAVALVVAGPWWWMNLATIVDYVGSWGFGAKSRDIGPSSPVVRLLLLTLGGVFMHFRVLLAVPCVLVGIAVGRHLLNHRQHPKVLFDSHRDMIAVISMVSVGFVVLASSSNMGSNFTFPLMMLGVAIVVALGAMVSGRLVRLAAVIAVFGSLANVALVGLWDANGGPDTRPVVAQALLFAGVDRPRHPELWASAQRKVAHAIASYAEDPAAGDRVVQHIVGGSQTFRDMSIWLSEVLAGLPVLPDTEGTLDPGTTSRPRVIVVIRVDQSTLGPGGVPDDPVPTLKAALARGWHVAQRIELPDHSGDVLILTHPRTPS